MSSVLNAPRENGGSESTNNQIHAKQQKLIPGPQINDIGFVDVTNRVLATPANGEVEVWDLENRSGGWVHPIHIHLVAFKVISRSGGDDRGVEPYEQGFKDVVFLDKNERARVVARFHPWAGQYMFHCHNLVHEDHDMMAAFDVNNTLADPDNNGDRFSNPMAAEFRPTRYTGTDLRTVRTETLPRFSDLDAYSFTARGN
jgi:bilirubin oxidase